MQPLVYTDVLQIHYTTYIYINIYIYIYIVQKCTFYIKYIWCSYIYNVYSISYIYIYIYIYIYVCIYFKRLKTKLYILDMLDGIEDSDSLGNWV